jgi:hypothetical protein
LRSRTTPAWCCCLSLTVLKLRSTDPGDRNLDGGGPYGRSTAERPTNPPAGPAVRGFRWQQTLLARERARTQLPLSGASP